MYRGTHRNYREEEAYYSGPTQKTGNNQQQPPRNKVQQLKRQSSGNLQAVEKPKVRTRRDVPDRYVATVHTQALTIDGAWAYGEAEMVVAVIEDAHEDLFYATMETYGLTSARIVSVEHDVLTVMYMKQGWFRKKLFPVQHLFITMLVEDLS